MVLDPPRDLEPRHDVKGGSKKTPAGGIALSKFLKWQKENVTETKNVMDTAPRGSTPVPDPTVLTTQQLVREIAASREIIETRLDAMDIATQINKVANDNIPRMIDEKVRQLSILVDEKIAGLMEKFHSVDVQFKERDTRTEQSSKDSKVAVDAALQAAKEAVGEQNKSSALAIAKSEAATNKQLDQIGTLIQTTTKGLDEKINDLKGRLDRGEGQKVSAVENKGQQNWFIGLFVIGGLSVVSIIITVVALIIKA